MTGQSKKLVRSLLVNNTMQEDHTNTDHRLKQLQDKIQDMKGLRVNGRQDESSYPTDSLVVKRTGPSGTIPVRIQDLVIERELEIIDVDSEQRTLWVIPHRGHREVNE